MILAAFCFQDLSEKRSKTESSFPKWHFPVYSILGCWYCIFVINTPHLTRTSLSLSTVLFLLRTTSESCSEYQSGHCNIKSFKTLQHSSDVKVHLLVQRVLLLILPEKEMKKPVDFQRIIAPRPPSSQPNFTGQRKKTKQNKNVINYFFS